MNGAPLTGFAVTRSVIDDGSGRVNDDAGCGVARRDGARTQCAAEFVVLARS
jgi:hypothetical protein